MHSPWLCWLIVSVHLLAGAAWFGSMFYSLTVLHPRARKFFNDDEQFEFFIASISQGARWKVLGAFAIIAGSGAALVFLKPLTHVQWILLVVKIALFLFALVIFCYASWILWPRRIFAGPEELRAVRRRFYIVGFSLICIAAISMALGILGHLI